MSINHIVLMGRLGADPVIRSTQSGLKVANFRMAVDRPFGGGEKKTDWFSCTAWRSTADYISKYFRKGDMIAVVGWIGFDTRQDKDGVDREYATVTVTTASSTGKNSGDGQRTAGDGNKSAGFHELPNNDTLPF